MSADDKAIKAGFPAFPTYAVGEHRRPHDAGIGLQAARRTASASCRFSEHPHRADRRRRARPAVYLRRRSPNPDYGPHRQGRDRVQPIPHYGHVLAHAGVRADWPESSPRRQWADCGTGERLGRILGPHSQEQRAGGRGTERLWLQYGGLGKVAQHTRRGNDRRRSLRELAD